MNMLEHIMKAKEKALTENIIANTVVIDQDVAKVNGFNVGFQIGDFKESISCPPMIAGLKVEYAKLDPELATNFFVLEKHESKKLDYKEAFKVLCEDSDCITHYVENGIRTIGFGKDQFVWQEDWDLENFNVVWDCLEAIVPLEA